MATFGERLKQERKSRGIRLKDIAEATKIPAMASTVREYPAPARRSFNAMNALSLKRRGSGQ